MLLLALGTTATRAQSELAGSYKSGTQSTQVVVSTWGEDCGPRPRNASDSDHPSVTVTVKGAQLTLAFPDRKLRSDGCWSPNPAVRFASSTAAAGRWRTECQTPSSDAKRERGVYTLTTGGEGVLELLEESSYDWQLNESRCVAKIRVTQRLARGAAVAELDKPAPQPEPAPTAPPTHCVPGPLARLRMRPTELRIAPGERTCFTVRGEDSAGCTVPELGTVKWDLTKPPGADASMSGSCFKAAAGAAEAEGQFKITVMAGSVRDETTITVASTDLSDITARRSNAGSELEIDGSDEAASSLGIEAAVKRSSTSVKVALGALALCLLLGLAWYVSGRTRKRRGVGFDDDEEEPAHANSDVGLADTRAGSGSQRPRGQALAQGADVKPSSPTSGSGEQLICPVCRHGYPGGTERCPRDGATPIPYGEFVRKARGDEAVPRTCAACGAQLAAGALFCGECGAKVHS